MTTTREAASDSQELSSHSHPAGNRPRQLDLFPSDYGDIDNPIPSPPYQRDLASSHLLLQDHPEHSPAYRSRSNLDLSATMGDQKTVDLTDDEPQVVDTKRKPSVHYGEDVTSPPPNSARPLFTRLDSNYTDGDHGDTGSRTPSIAGTDTEDEDEDYDWSGEEDLVDEEAKFEQQMGTKKVKRPWGFRRIVTLLFSSLIGSTFLSGVIITPALLVHFFWYKPHPDDHRKYVKDNVEAWLFWAAANVTISWYLAFLIDIVPVLIRFFVSLTWGHVTESIKSKLDLYNSVKDTVKPVFYAASCWVSWVILFESIFQLYNPDDPDNSRAAYTPRVFDAIEFLFFFALVICAQKMLSHAIAFSFHRTAYRERLDSITHTLNVIEKLRRYRPKRGHAHKSSFAFGRQTPVLSAFALSPFSDKEQTDRGSRRPSPIPSRAGTPDRFGDVMSGNEADGEDPDATLVKKKKDKGKQRTSWLAQPVETAEPQSTTSTTRHHDYATSPHAYPPSVFSPSRSGAVTPNRKANSSEGDDDAGAIVHQAAKALKSAVLHDARNIRGKSDDDLGGLVWNVTSAHEAKRLARAIYTVFRKRNRNYLQPSDFEPAFKDKDEARAAFRVFDTDNNGDISRAEIKTTLIKVYKERRFLSRSMRDIGMALKTLDHILLFFALIILLFISLSVFDVNVGDSLTSLYSIGIALSFIFKNSASSAFDAIMFLFVTHPFDTGDRCFIDDENLVVKKMGLFATIFTRSDGTETYYFNSLLFTKFIINARRSAKTFENLTMQVAWRTPLEKLDALEQCLNDWLSTEPNRWFEPSTSVTLQKINYQRHLELTIGIGHNGTWQDWGLRLARKTAFHAAVQYYCRQLGIVAHEAAMPIAWADQDTMDYIPQTPGTHEEEEHDDTDSLAPPPKIPFDGASQQESRPLVLGFQPPSERHVGVRARKSKSRKAVLRTIGADG